MSSDTTISDPKAAARLAGALYLVIIVFGIWSEVAVRAPLAVAGDPAATAANIVAAAGQLRLSFAADMVLALADAGLAVVLFLLLRPVSFALSLAAMVFRLLQAAVIGVNLLNQHTTLLILENSAAVAALGPDVANALAALALETHSHGYDLGLVFFGVNSLLVGSLVIRSGYLPRSIGFAMLAAGVVYLAGSGIRFLAPSLTEPFAAAYLVPLIAETAFCLWLLVRGLDVDRFRAASTA